MIEIAFDEHLDGTFKGKAYPMLNVPDLGKKPFEDYLSYADSVLKQHTSDLYLIVLTDNSRFSTSKLALALFVKSCLYPNNNLECVVFKTTDTRAAFEAYKPYIATSIGIKYAIRLANEDIRTIYKELKCLNYLNFTIFESFLNRTLSFKPNNPTTKIKETHTAFEALLWVSLFKILSLAEMDMPFVLLVHISTESEKIDSDLLLNSLLKEVSEYIDL